MTIGWFERIEQVAIDSQLIPATEASRKHTTSSYLPGEQAISLPDLLPGMRQSCLAFMLDRSRAEPCLTETQCIASPGVRETASIGTNLPIEGL
jgi:hypothetical protein